MKKILILTLSLIFILLSQRAIASIKLIKFEAYYPLDLLPDNYSVLISWKTAREINTQGFNIWRSEKEDGDYIKLNPDLIKPLGGQILGAEYTYTDQKALYGVNYYYHLEEIDVAGQSTLYDDKGEVVPSEAPDASPSDETDQADHDDSSPRIKLPSSQGCFLSTVMDNNSK